MNRSLKSGRFQPLFTAIHGFSAAPIPRLSKTDNFEIRPNWNGISGAEVVSLSVTPDGSVYCLTTGNIVYKYTGVGNNWKGGF